MNTSFSHLVKKTAIIATLGSASIYSLTIAASAQTTEIDFKDSVIATYETALTLRSLPKVKGNPDYDRLMSECRYHLYNSMKFAATSGNWTKAQELIPAAEVCSYTGKVFPSTTAEYQAQWQQAVTTANSLPKPQEAPPEPITASVDVKPPVNEAEVKPLATKQQPEKKPLDDGCTSFEAFEEMLVERLQRGNPHSIVRLNRFTNEQNLSAFKAYLKSEHNAPNEIISNLTDIGIGESSALNRSYQVELYIFKSGCFERKLTINQFIAIELIKKSFNDW